jgi:hypothetical protein
MLRRLGPSAVAWSVVVAIPAARAQPDRGATTIDCAAHDVVCIPADVNALYDHDHDPRHPRVVVLAPGTYALTSIDPRTGAPRPAHGRIELPDAGTTFDIAAAAASGAGRDAGGVPIGPGESNAVELAVCAPRSAVRVLPAPPAWSPATTYARDASATYPAEGADRSVYLSLQAGNANHPPEVAGDWWVHAYPFEDVDVKESGCPGDAAAAARASSRALTRRPLPGCELR